jgi:hypothetical protein
MAQTGNDRLQWAKGKSKATYKSPCLVVYGSIRELTAGDTGSHADTGKMNHTKRGT